mmetsp:Transcript_11146/g.30824  ORF Transcript_11146/g.30824 Transcript_11146/m.30824 type:complete len:86 (+) Transcript_11146:185-442(+)
MRASIFARSKTSATHSSADAVATPEGRLRATRGLHAAHGLHATRAHHCAAEMGSSIPITATQTCCASAEQEPTNMSGISSIIDKC